MSKTDTKLQERLMKNALLERKMNGKKKHADLEQYTRKYNLEIVGIPDVEDEDLEDVVIKLARSIGADVESEDIDIQ